MGASHLSCVGAGAPQLTVTDSTRRDLVVGDPVLGPRRVLNIHLNVNAVLRVSIRKQLVLLRGYWGDKTIHEGGGGYKEVERVVEKSSKRKETDRQYLTKKNKKPLTNS